MMELLTRSFVHSELYRAAWEKRIKQTQRKKVDMVCTWKNIKCTGPIQQLHFWSSFRYAYARIKFLCVFYICFNKFSKQQQKKNEKLIYEWKNGEKSEPNRFDVVITVSHCWISPSFFVLWSLSMIKSFKLLILSMFFYKKKMVKSKQKTKYEEHLPLHWFACAFNFHQLKNFITFSVLWLGLTWLDLTSGKD